MNDPLNPIHNIQLPEDEQDGQRTKFEPLTPQDKPQSQWRRWHLPVLLLFVIGTFLIINRKNAPAPYQQNEGAVFGTFYHLNYQSREDLQTEVEDALKGVDGSLSMFNPQSIISRVNQNEDVKVDSLFRRVFLLSQRVSEATDGAFDITVAPLVNAWGFGFKNGTLPDSATVDSLRAHVGWQRIQLTADNHIVKDDPQIILDCSAVAKGFGVDVVADLLRSKGVENFMVEIGGEVVVSGVNPKGEAWRIGVNKPNDDPTSSNHELETVLALDNQALATSGNYRNFYVTDDGRRVAHTIDPHTGYPVQHSLLSATVLAPTCAEADAFATSFMVLGVERAKEVLKRHTELQVFFIYDSLGQHKTYSTIQ
ncbi:MAG: FAD:protein FMN transferase [Bacteroidaceae bacterium]|nr:FAD:protein FMN transferase [Bacteroidaceae bacterium]